MSISKGALHEDIREETIGAINQEAEANITAAIEEITHEEEEEDMTEAMTEAMTEVMLGDIEDHLEVANTEITIITKEGMRNSTTRGDIQGTKAWKEKSKEDTLSMRQHRKEEHKESRPTQARSLDILKEIEINYLTSRIITQTQ